VNKWEPRGGSKSDPTNPSGSEAVGEVAQFWGIEVCFEDLVSKGGKCFHLDLTN
jgi:hypothetical protein